MLSSLSNLPKDPFSTFTFLSSVEDKPSGKNLVRNPDGSYYLDIPGVDPESVKVTTGGKTIRIKAGTKEYYTEFGRSLSPDSVKVSYKWGRLTLSFLSPPVSNPVSDIPVTIE